MRAVIVCGFLIAGILLMLVPLQYDFAVRQNAMNFMREHGVSELPVMGFIHAEYIWACFSAGVGLLVAALFGAVDNKRRTII